MKGDAGIVDLLDFCRVCKVPCTVVLEGASKMLFRG